MIEAQAAAAGLPVRFVQFDWAASLTEHDSAIQEALLGVCSTDGTEFVAFSEIFSVRARRRRSELLERIGLRPLFPLWGRDPAEHVAEILGAGLKALVCSVETDRVPARHSGCRFDENFVAALPDDVDPCGEYGEFHTFVEWAPGWSSQVSAVSGSRIERYGFAFAEIGEPPQEAKGETAVPPKAGNDPFDYYARLRRVREHVDQHLEDHLDLRALAPVAAMSDGGFGRFFREATGQSFHDWLVARRLERAVLLLREHNEPIARVAEAVGFGSERTFRRLFQRRFGSTPSRFRSQVRDGRA